MSSGLSVTFLTSALLHLLGLTALSMVGSSLWSPAPPANVIPMELHIEPPPPAMSEPVAEFEPEPEPPNPVEQSAPPAVPPPPEPPPQPVTPPKLEKVIPPKLLEKPLPERTAPHVKTPPPVSRMRLKESAPPEPSGTPRATASHAPVQPGPSLPADASAAAGNVLGPSAERPPEATPPPPLEGGEAGAGKLFERGDMGVVPGAGAGGGGGGSGRTGLGTGGPGAGAGTRVAGMQPGAGGLGDGSGLARPLGGYQIKPRYPESARRQGAEGTTLLKIYVGDQGTVEDVLVARSAGHQDLDLAAMEAVKQWRFEPARQGQRPVAVWVMLPVRFALK
jgi:periplasmic protein TonB